MDSALVSEAGDLGSIPSDRTIFVAPSGMRLKGRPA